jgi:hypothetical protein
MTRKVLRFGPSINMIKTIITNINLIVKGGYKEDLHMLVLKTLSSLFLALFFICDHYIWLFRVIFLNNQRLDSLKIKPLKLNSTISAH